MTSEVGDAVTGSMEQGLVPKLRFPEFQDGGAWTISTVGDVFTVTRGNVLAMPLVADDPTSEKPYPVYSSQTKKNGRAGYYSEFLFEDAITWTTDGANAGDVNFREGKFYCTNVCGVLVNHKGFANECVAAIINSVSRNYVSYVGNPKLMNGVMANIRVPLPSIAEQQKIADCLSSLDAVIAAEGERLAALKAHKKGLMQQLLPAKDQTTPCLRFPEFEGAGAWEEKPLGEIASYQNGKAYEPHIVESGRYVVVNARFISTDGVVKKWSNNPMLIADKDDILMVLSDLPNGRALAKCYRVSEDDRYAVNQRISRLKPHSVRSDFLVSVLNRHPYLLGFNDGMNQTHLSKDNVLTCPILMPADEEEQIAIADCLEAADKAIAGQNDRLGVLKLHKKALIQQLFPSPVETTA